MNLHSGYILHTKQLLHVIAVSLAHESSFSQCTLTVSSFLCQNVTLERMLTLDFTRSSKSETLLCAGIGFHLWHNALNF